VYKSNYNSDQAIGQESNATRIALITAVLNYMPDENNQNKIKNVTFDRKTTTVEYWKFQYSI